MATYHANAITIVKDGNTETSGMYTFDSTADLAAFMDTIESADVIGSATDTLDGLADALDHIQTLFDTTQIIGDDDSPILIDDLHGIFADDPDILL